MKVIFPNRIDGKLCLCPFIGFRANNYEDFINILKKYFNKSTGYPGLFFNLKDNKVLVFAGHQYKHGDGRWCIINKNTNDELKDWFYLKNKFDEVFQLFKDADELQKELDVMSAICKANNGITININF